MPMFDLPLDQLRDYRPEPHEPDDFDEFWAATLADARTHELEPVFTPYDAGLTLVDVSEVRFGGYGGQRVAGWFIVPRGLDAPSPCIVQYIGYAGGRGLAHDWLVWPNAGYPTLVMDSRGQGNSLTPDPLPESNTQHVGFMTRGVLERDEYYFRRLFTDAVRAVDAAAAHPLVDPARIVIAGGSQGGGIAQAVAGLHEQPCAAMIDVPFLTHFPRALEVAGAPPYTELVKYLSANRDREAEVMRTLSYFDGLSFAARATCPALYSVGLMDEVCPPSTVFAAHNRYGGTAEIVVWKYNGHEGGATFQVATQLDWVRRTLASVAVPR